MHINFKSQCLIIIVLQISFVHLPVQVTRTKELHRYTGIKEPSTFIGTINCFYVQNFVFHIHLPLCKQIVVKATPLGSKMSTDQSNLIQFASLFCFRHLTRRFQLWSNNHLFPSTTQLKCLCLLRGLLFCATTFLLQFLQVLKK